MTNQSHAWDRFAPTAGRQQEPLTTTWAEPETSTAPMPGTRIVPGEVVASSVTEPPRQVSRVEVGQGGAILLHDDAAAGRETVAEVTTDTFYTAITDKTAVGDRAASRVSVLTHLTLAVDLNAIADAVKSAQRGEPTDPAKRVYVGSEGELLLGNEASGGERIAEVTGDTFYASRLEKEAAFVHSNMPRNTVRVSDGTYEGWHYTITNEFGDSYSLFLYYHPSYGVYRVALIDPRMEGTVDAHGTHLWPDGTLCLTRASGSGYSSMGATYAKAALWIRGASCYRRGYGFQFNVGQD